MISTATVCRGYSGDTFFIHGGQELHKNNSYGTNLTLAVKILANKISPSGSSALVNTDHS